MELNRFENLPEFKMSENVSRKLLAYCSGEFGYTVNLMKAAAGNGAPPHSHRHLQVVYVIEGEGEFNTGSENKVIKAGDVVEIGANVPHTFNSFAKDTVWLEFFTPEREDFSPNK